MTEGPKTTRLVRKGRMGEAPRVMEQCIGAAERVETLGNKRPLLDLCNGVAEASRHHSRVRTRMQFGGSHSKTIKITLNDLYKNNIKSYFASCSLIMLETDKIVTTCSHLVQNTLQLSGSACDIRVSKVSRDGTQ